MFMEESLMTQTSKRLPPGVLTPPGKMTYEEFLAWADEDVHAEWVDGEVEFINLEVDPQTGEWMVSVSRTHTRIGRFLILILQAFVEAFGLGEIFYEPYQMKTGPDLPGREPDVLFVAKENLYRLREKHLEGPGDLVVEIVSEERERRDRVTKLAEYERGGVREYWIIDPLQREALFYHLGPDGHYRQVAVGADGVYHSAVLNGLWIKPEWFWQEPLPPLMTVLKAWNLL
jgi:Uma2 family endonuclease